MDAYFWRQQAAYFESTVVLLLSQSICTCPHPQTILLSKWQTYRRWAERTERKRGDWERILKETQV